MAYDITTPSVLPLLPLEGLRVFAIAREVFVSLAPTWPDPRRMSIATHFSLVGVRQSLCLRRGDL